MHVTHQIQVPDIKYSTEMSHVVRNRITVIDSLPHENVLFPKSGFLSCSNEGFFSFKMLSFNIV